MLPFMGTEVLSKYKKAICGFWRFEGWIKPRADRTSLKAAGNTDYWRVLVLVSSGIQQVCATRPSKTRSVSDRLEQD